MILCSLQKEFSYFNHSFGHLSCQVADSCNILCFAISKIFINVPFEIAPNRTPVMDPSRIRARSNCIPVGGNRFNFRVFCFVAISKGTLIIIKCN